MTATNWNALIQVGEEAGLRGEALGDYLLTVSELVEKELPEAKTFDTFGREYIEFLNARILSHPDVTDYLQTDDGKRYKIAIENEGESYRIIKTATAATHPSRRQNVAVIGHSGHGKSSLVGRLLFETGGVPEHVIEQHREKAEEKGKGGFEFAYVMDNLAEERERGVTIDIAHQELSTDTHDFTLIDCPGHRDFVKNMITGVSNADNALLVVAADAGVESQTQEHLFLARTLGVSEILVAVNKMDQVGYRNDRYEVVCEAITDLLAQVQFSRNDVTFVPVSALDGENISTESEQMPWYDGSALLDLLDELPAPKHPVGASLRLPIQDVYTISGIGTVPVGRIEAGVLRKGETVSFQPSGASGEVKVIEMHHEECEEAYPGDNVGFNVRGIGKGDIQRGAVCGPVDDPPTVAETFSARITVHDHPAIITPGYTPIFHVHTAQVACTIESIDQLESPKSGDIVAESPDAIETGDVARVTVRPQEPLVVESVATYPKLGRFAIRDMGQTIASGTIIDVTERL
ncbi:translation elongation factor EF-1 subunit alpha [Halorubrum rutilum]|uniref:Elongation factor 1-alpha n=1 Tax=Halorubrum rutilum TaxID=1364933 RepID=A0ABD6AP42_9EURY